jgi:hypothetical protein
MFSTQPGTIKISAENQHIFIQEASHKYKTEISVALTPSEKQRKIIASQTRPFPPVLVARVAEIGKVEQF